MKTNPDKPFPFKLPQEYMRKQEESIDNLNSDVLPENGKSISKKKLPIIPFILIAIFLLFAGI